MCTPGGLVEDRCSKIYIYIFVTLFIFKNPTDFAVVIRDRPLDMCAPVFPICRSIIPDTSCSLDFLLTRSIYTNIQCKYTH